jgi:hypothetical protein
MGECENCHTKRWKYQVTEQRNPCIQRSLCEPCCVDALQTLGLFDVKMREPADEK